MPPAAVGRRSPSVSDCRSCGAAPVPWSASPATSHLLTADETRATLESAGFSITRFEDLTEVAIGWFADQRRASDPSAGAEGRLGQHVVMGSGFAEMAGNLAVNLTAGRAPRRPAGDEIGELDKNATWWCGGSRLRIIAP